MNESNGGALVALVADRFAAADAVTRAELNRLIAEGKGDVDPKKTKTCSVAGCGKTLRSDNSKGICGGCQGKGHRPGVVARPRRPRAVVAVAARVEAVEAPPELEEIDPHEDLLAMTIEQVVAERDAAHRRMQRSDDELRRRAKQIEAALTGKAHRTEAA